MKKNYHLTDFGKGDIIGFKAIVCTNLKILEYTET